MNIGKLGVWSVLDSLPAATEADFARRLERWGYTALWSSEVFGRNVLVNAAWLLANTRTLIVASGIANIHGRDAMAMAAARAQLNEQSGGRFLLGVGISHAPLVAVRGHAYDKPASTLRAYLESMQRTPYHSVPPAARAPMVVGALGPKMLAVARDLADGAHPYNTTVAQTAEQRRILGPDKLLCVEQKILLETDAARARAIARANLRRYAAAANYVNSWRRAGFTEQDVGGDLSDRLIDALIAWGDEDAIVARIREHWAAGADHVCVQALHSDPTKQLTAGPNVDLLQRLAPFAEESNAR